MFCDSSYYENCVENLWGKEYEYLTKSDVACLIKTDTGKLFFGLMVILAVIEFFVALFASIFISPGCCSSPNRGMLLLNFCIIGCFVAQRQRSSGTIPEFDIFPVFRIK